MKIAILGSITLLGFSNAFAPLYCATKNPSNVRVSAAKSPIPSRRQFVAGGIVGSIVGQVNPAQSRGRATLEQSYERYSPRLVEGGRFYSKDLRKAIEKSDWAAIKVSYCFSLVRVYYPPPISFLCNVVRSTLYVLKLRIELLIPLCAKTNRQQHKNQEKKQKPIDPKQTVEYPHAPPSPVAFPKRVS